MLVVRWLRSVAMLVFGLVLFSPVVALPLAVLVDRGPEGEARVSPHLFPLVLWLFDDFAWTCSRNSLIFATIVSVLSLGVGRCVRLGCRPPSILGTGTPAPAAGRVDGGAARVSRAGT